MFHFRHLDENDDINEEENGDEDQTDFDEDDDDDAFDEVLLELSPEEQELYRSLIRASCSIVRQPLVETLLGQKSAILSFFYSRDNPH